MQKNFEKQRKRYKYTMNAIPISSSHLSTDQVHCCLTLVIWQELLIRTRLDSKSFSFIGNIFTTFHKMVRNWHLFKSLVEKFLKNGQRVLRFCT